MRWFTRAWHRGDLGDAYDYEGLVRAYWAHIDMLLPTASPSIRELAHLNLHDARFEEVIIDVQSRSIKIRLIGGDRQHGYCALALVYRGAVLDGMATSEVKYLVERPRTEILYDEIDTVDSGRYEQRFLIWPEGEFAIRFEDVGLSRVTTTARRYAGAIGCFEILNDH
jgi:hypothetical protein